MVNAEQKQVEAALLGDTLAFGELVILYKALIGAIVIAKMKSAANVEDVVQETFLAAWLQRKSLADPTKFRPWLSAIARNKAIKAEQKHTRSLDVMTEPADSEELQRGESRELALAAALEQVPESQREILVLFYREEQSIRQVACALGITESAAQRRISRARGTVRDKMQNALDALPASRRTGTAVAVLAAIISDATTAAAATTQVLSAATTVKTTTLARTLATLKLTTKLMFATAVLCGGTVLYYQTRSTKQEHVVIAPTVNSPQQGKANPANNVSIRIVSRNERQRRYPPARIQTPRAPVDSIAVIRSTIKDIRPLVDECYDLARSRRPKLAGNITLGLQTAMQQEIAGLIVEIDVEERTGLLTPPDVAFEECLRETFLSIQFIGLRLGARISYPLQFRVPASSYTSNTEVETAIAEETSSMNLLILARELGAQQSDLAMKACRKALSSPMAGYMCTQLACELNREQEAHEMWAVTATLNFQTLASQIREMCLKQGIQLSETPQPPAEKNTLRDTLNELERKALNGDKETVIADCTALVKDTTTWVTTLRCTQFACTLKDKDDALAFWSRIKAHKPDWSFVEITRNVCSANDIVLPEL